MENMTLKDWAINEINIARVKAETLRSGGSAYNDALDAVLKLQQIRDNEIWRQCADEDRAAGLYGVAPVELSAAPKDAEPEVSDPPASSEEPDAPTRTVTKPELRAKAAAAKQAGISLTGIWQHYGGSKLSDVPEDKYFEAFDMIEQMMQEAYIAGEIH